MPGHEEKQKKAACEADAPYYEPRKQRIPVADLRREASAGKCWRSAPLESSQDDDLTARPVLLHAAVRLDDVIEFEDSPDLDG
jgi:hypothetical protein